MPAQPGYLLPRLSRIQMHAQLKPAASLCTSEWAGLQAWRSAPLNEYRWWSGEEPARWEQADGESVKPHNSVVCKEKVARSSQHTLGVGFERWTEDCLSHDDVLDGSPPALRSLAGWGALVLSTSCPQRKASLTHRAFQLWHDGSLALGVATAPDTPARPAKPELVSEIQIFSDNSNFL